MDLERKVGKELTKHIDGDYIDKMPSGYGLIYFVYENYFYLYNPTTKEFVSLVEGSSSPCNDHGACCGCYVNKRIQNGTYVHSK